MTAPLEYVWTTILWLSLATIPSSSLGGTITSFAVQSSVLGNTTQPTGQTIELICRYEGTTLTFMTIYRTPYDDVDVGVTPPFSLCGKTCATDKNGPYEFSIASSNSWTILTTKINGINRNSDEMWWTCGAIDSDKHKKSFKLTVATEPSGIIIPSVQTCNLANTPCTVVCQTTSCIHPSPSSFSWFYTTDGTTESNIFGLTNTVSTDTGDSCSAHEKVYKSVITIHKYTTLPNNTAQAVRLFCRLMFATLTNQLTSNFSGSIQMAVKVNEVSIINLNMGAVLTITEHQSAELQCKTSGSRPNSTVYWYRMEGSLKHRINNGITSESKQTEDGLVETTSTLTFPVTRYEQGLVLTCGASNFNTSEVFAKNPKTLEVLYSPNVTGFTAGAIGGSMFPESVTVDEYVDVKGTCNVDSNPSSTIEVSHKDEIIGKTDAGLTTHFRISNVTCYNNGKIVCNAKNKIPEIVITEETLQLNVKCSPRIAKETNSAVVAQEGTMAVLSLTALAYPPPAYQWHRYKIDHWETITNGSEFTMTSNNLQYNLTVTNVTRNHYGEYNLTLSNEHEPPLTFTFTLQNKGRPEVPVDISVTVKSSTAITVRWTPGYDGEVEQTFHVEYKPINANDWLEVEVADSRIDERLSMDISGLQSSTEYALRMFASNEEGNSSLSETLSFRTRDPESTSSAGTVGGAIGGVIAVGIAIVGVVFVVRRKGIPAGMTRKLFGARSNDKENRIQYIQDKPAQEETAYTHLEALSNDRDGYQSLDFAQQKNCEQGHSKHEDQCYENPLPIYDDDKSGNQKRQTRTKTVAEREPKSDRYYANLQFS